MMRRISDEKQEWRYIREQLQHANTAVQTLKDELDVLNPGPLGVRAQELVTFEKTENELASTSGSPHSDEAAAPEAVDLNEDPFDAP